MKNWTWKRWVSMGVFSVIFLAAITLLVIGIVTHEEPGFSNPEAQWVSPVTVTCAGYVPEEDEACDVAEDVVGVVNSRLGFEMLRWDPTNVGGSIHITMRAPVEVGGSGPCGQPGECFELRGSGDTYTECRMQTMNASGGAGNLEWLTVYHGLGHCLGLAHDDYKQSIMYPVQEATPDRTIPSWISDWDRKLLRERYLVE